MSRWSPRGVTNGDELFWEDLYNEASNLPTTRPDQEKERDADRSAGVSGRDAGRPGDRCWSCPRSAGLPAHPSTSAGRKHTGQKGQLGRGRRQAVGLDSTTAKCRAPAAGTRQQPCWESKFRCSPRAKRAASARETEPGPRCPPCVRLHRVRPGARHGSSSLEKGPSPPA